MDLMQRISVKLIYSNPFFGHLIMQARKVRNDDLEYAMAIGVVDGMIELEYNQTKLEGYLETYHDNWDFLLGVAEHELLHIIFKHWMRRQDRNAVVSIGGKMIGLWNVAADIAINPLIKKPLPDGVLFPSLFNLKDGLTAEQYYSLLLKQAKANGVYFAVDALGNTIGNKDDNGNGGDDSDKEGDGESEWDKKLDGKDLLDSHDKWMDVQSDDGKQSAHENAIIRSAVKKALDHAKRMGKMPGAVEEAINEILKPPAIPWTRILRQYIGDSFKIGHSYTWKRPSRRFGSLFKGKRAIKALDIIVCIDTSGSIGSEEFGLFISEIIGIRNSYPTNITIIEIDAAVQKVYKLKKEVDVKFKGRGGTDFAPAFKYVEDKKIKCGLLVYLTDLCGSFPKDTPPYPVIWVKTPSRFGFASTTVPFGKLIEIDDSKRRAA